MNAKVIAELDKSVFPHRGQYTCLVDGDVLRIEAACEYEAALSAAEYVDKVAKPEGAFRVVVLNSATERMEFLVNRRIEYTGSLVAGPA